MLTETLNLKLYIKRIKVQHHAKIVSRNKIKAATILENSLIEKSVKLCFPKVGLQVSSLNLGI